MRDRLTTDSRNSACATFVVRCTTWCNQCFSCVFRARPRVRVMTYVSSFALHRFFVSRLSAMFGLSPKVSP